jgi:hypothetical protein
VLGASAQRGARHGSSGSGASGDHPGRTSRRQ